MATVRISELGRSGHLSDVMVNDTTHNAKLRSSRNSKRRNIVVDVDERQDYTPTESAIKLLQSSRWL